MINISRCEQLAPDEPVSLWVSYTVLDHIRSLTLHSPRVETGGILLGPACDGKLIVTQATGPGCRAVQRRDYFLRDTHYCETILQAAYVSNRWDYIGEWHSHVIPLPRPSAGDVTTMLRIVTDADYEFTHVAMLLALLDGKAVSIGGYVATGAGIKAVSVRAFETLQEVR